MTNSIFTELYPSMSEMRDACYRVMRGTETLSTNILSEEENNTLRKLSEKWINEFDKYKDNLVDEMINEINEL